MSLTSPLAPEWLDLPEDLNKLHPLLWSANVERVDDQLAIAGVPVTQLAQDFGTPLYVVDEDDFRARARAFKTAFDQAFSDICGGVDVYFAGKSFLCSEVARWITQEGLRLDTASGGELTLALRSGVPPENIGFHGNNKSEAELVLALESGVGRIVVDSAHEVERLVRLAAERQLVAPVMVRVTPGVHAHTHEFIATAHEDQKFGLSLADGQAQEVIAEIVKHPSELRFLGLHSHIGSQIFDVDGLAEATKRVLQFAKKLHDEQGVQTSELDMGGGYGVAYTPADQPKTPQVLAQAIARVVAQTVNELAIPAPRISIEPGRAIAAPSTFTLYTVGTVKTVSLDEGTRTYISVDGGMSDNIRPALYDADYSVLLASRISSAAPVIARVVGKHCESGDIVVKDAYLPADVQPGDLLAVPGTGAYGWTMASNYNYVPRPAVIAVRSGQARVIVRGETIDDLLSRDLGLAGE